MWKHNNIGCIVPDELIHQVASFSALLYKSTCYDVNIRYVTSSGLHKSYFSFWVMMCTTLAGSAAIAVHFIASVLGSTVQAAS